MTLGLQRCKPFFYGQFNFEAQKAKNRGSAVHRIGEVKFHFHFNLETAVERCPPFDNARCAGYSGRTASHPSGESMLPFVLSVAAGFAAESKHANCGF